MILSLRLLDRKNLTNPVPNPNPDPNFNHNPNCKLILASCFTLKYSQPAGKCPVNKRPEGEECPDGRQRSDDGDVKPVDSWWDRLHVAVGRPALLGTRPVANAVQGAVHSLR